VDEEDAARCDAESAELRDDLVTASPFTRFESSIALGTGHGAILTRRERPRGTLVMESFARVVRFAIEL
jgi:hypothetical protein